MCKSECMSLNTFPAVSEDLSDFRKRWKSLKLKFGECVTVYMLLLPGDVLYSETFKCLQVVQLCSECRDKTVITLEIMRAVLSSLNLLIYFVWNFYRGYFHNAEHLFSALICYFFGRETLVSHNFKYSFNSVISQCTRILLVIRGR